MTLGSKHIPAILCAAALAVFAAQAAAQQQPAQTNETTASPGLPSTPMPKDPRTRAKAHTELGSLYFQDGNLIVALEELTLAAAIDPDYAPALSTRGVVLYYVKEFDSAEKDFRRALSLEENNPDINNNYGWFLCNTNRARESLAYFERAYRNPLYQTPGNAYLNAGACQIKLGALNQADEALRTSLRLMPNNTQAMYHLADIQYKRGNYAAARKWLADAARLGEPGPEALWLQLRIERRLRNRDEEESLAAQLRRRFPDSPEYQALLKRNFE
ncbi:MAG: type IV pilus biogenesis/stability protein PilW [Candidatus Accumulibacter sp.]|jgi:type IV pilus assembly protein PilF|nr:type IV pilus biogenesis/stability protein PilW [Accumulibacter sp.]